MSYDGFSGHQNSNLIH